MYEACPRAPKVHTQHPGGTQDVCFLEECDAKDRLRWDIHELWSTGEEREGADGLRQRKKEQNSSPKPRKASERKGRGEEEDRASDPSPRTSLQRWPL